MFYRRRGPESRRPSPRGWPRERHAQLIARGRGRAHPEGFLRDFAAPHDFAGFVRLLAALTAAVVVSRGIVLEPAAHAEGGASESGKPEG